MQVDLQQNEKYQHRHFEKKAMLNGTETMANLLKAVIQVPILLSGPSCYSSGRHGSDEESLRDLGLDAGRERRQVCDDAALGRTGLMLLLAVYVTMQNMVAIRLEIYEYADKRLKLPCWFMRRQATTRSLDLVPANETATYSKPCGSQAHMVGGMNHLVDQIAMGHWPAVGHLLGVFSYGFFYIMSGESPPISLLIQLVFYLYA